MPVLSDDWHWRLVRLWFNGYRSLDKRGIACRSYLVGKYEQLARTFLVHALTHSKVIPYDIRQMLSEAFDDDGYSSLQYPSHRKLEFKFRKKGNRVDGIRQADILLKMKNSVKEFGKIDAAVAHLVATYGLSRSEILKIWGRYKDEGLHGIILNWFSDLKLTDSSTTIESHGQYWFEGELRGHSPNKS